MSNQIVPHTARPVPPGALDVWSQHQNQSQLGFAQPPVATTTPVQKVQRLLRGRVLLAIVLALIFGAIGGTLGAISQAPTYASLGMLEISPTIPMVEGDKHMPYYQQFMASQANTIKSPAVLDEVPAVEPWKSSPFAKDRGALLALGSNIKADYKKNTLNIELAFTDDNPQLASIGMQSIIAAYQNQYKTGASESVNRNLLEVETRQRKHESERRSAEKLINDITTKYGSADLEQRVSAAQRDVEEVSRDLRGYENNLKSATSAIEAMKGSGDKIALEELAQVDTFLSQLGGEIKASKLKLDTTQATLGANHPQVRQLKIGMEALNRSAEEYADTLRKEVLAIIPDFVKGGYMKVTPGQLRVLQARVAQLKQDLVGYEKTRDAIAADAGKVAGYRLTIKEAEIELSKVETLLEQYRFQAVTLGKLKVMQNGSVPATVANKKVMFGLAGTILGASLPIGLLLLAGLMDTRFRYSDDTTANSMSGIPLLGILPNLPDRLSDPAQASIAAHCVHQIRTMLQLNAMREGSTVFSVTSASSGDGKTSLSLALGLSFAASGSRTLLIDADLVGGGLTSRLGNTSPFGIVDALAGVNLDDCVQGTDVADLSILPIGSAQSHHAGGFSPPAVRKLLGELRKHFEVIIVDTGPVMGSIEATPICASVDGVVLTVARGQSRPLVERAITHLNSIGARVAGVVFNRAQHKDFEQSIGAISIRSAARSTANGTSHNARSPGDIGAVAQAVAANVRN
ncbi:MAG: AAA family ATPase [Burkholderiales bacterium]|nr:AAA family ATPase [Phycisphaerae bacterium]